jgi:hypothetical protein
MSMIGCFYALKDADLEAIIADPKRLQKLWGGDIVQPKQASFFARLFGAKPPPPPPKPVSWEPSEKAEASAVDTAWHGFHFLLTGTDWEGEGPTAFILHGGREIDEDLGYGKPHGFTSREVKEIARALEKVNIDELYEKADPAKFKENEIYPDIWEHEPKESSIGYVTENLKGLREFVQKTASVNRGLIAYLG